MFALPGGFVGTRESPEQTAERKLREKTGVGSVHLEQLRTYADPERDPRGWLPVDRLHGSRAARDAARGRARRAATRAGTRLGRCRRWRWTTRGSSRTACGG